MTTITLDVKGLACPLPVLRASKSMRELAPGDTLTVLATDPAAPKDFVAFSQVSGHEIVENETDGEVYRITLRKAN